MLKLHPLQATLQSLRFRLAIIAIDVALLYVPLYGKMQARLPLYMFSAAGKFDHVSAREYIPDHSR